MPTDKMASDDEACVNDPNFAIICSFFNKFGKDCGVQCPNIKSLQMMLENTQEVQPDLIELHVKLLRKARRTVHSEKWERALVKFIHTYSNQDAWNLERLGYQKLKLTQRLLILKNLLEYQFDSNTKFKAVITTSTADELRLQPIGRDTKGNAYWYQVDEGCNLRVYKEDLDEESWSLIAQSREELVQLISTLNGSDPNGVNTISNDDSNSNTISSLLASKNNDDSTPPDPTKTVSNSDKSKTIDADDSEEFLSPDDDENYYDDDVENDNAKDGMQSLKNDKDVAVINLSSESSKAKNDKITNKRKCDNSNKESDRIIRKKTKDDGQDLSQEDLEFGEVIEEPIMIITGQGSGADCNAGNPGESENEDNNEREGEKTTQIVEDKKTDKQIENKPLMFFGQPGCLKLNPVMVRTAGHASFSNVSDSNMPGKVLVKDSLCDSESENIVNNKDISSNDAKVETEVKKNVLETKVCAETSFSDVTIGDNNFLSENSLSESVSNKSLNESVSSVLLYEVTNLNIITPNASTTSIDLSQTATQDDSKYDLNNSNDDKAIDPNNAKKYISLVGENVRIEKTVDELEVNVDIQSNVNISSDNKILEKKNDTGISNILESSTNNLDITSDNLILPISDNSNKIIINDKDENSELLQGALSVRSENNLNENENKPSDDQQLEKISSEGCSSKAKETCTESIVDAVISNEEKVPSCKEDQKHLSHANFDLVQDVEMVPENQEKPKNVDTTPDLDISVSSLKQNQNTSFEIASTIGSMNINRIKENEFEKNAISLGVNDEIKFEQHNAGANTQEVDIGSKINREKTEKDNPKNKSLELNLIDGDQIQIISEAHGPTLMSSEQFSTKLDEKSMPLTNLEQKVVLDGNDTNSVPKDIEHTNQNKSLTSENCKKSQCDTLLSQVNNSEKSRAIENQTTVVEVIREESVSNELTSSDSSVHQNILKDSETLKDFAEAECLEPTVNDEKVEKKEESVQCHSVEQIIVQEKISDKINLVACTSSSISHDRATKIEEKDNYQLDKSLSNIENVEEVSLISESKCSYNIQKDDEKLSKKSINSEKSVDLVFETLESPHKVEDIIKKENELTNEDKIFIECNLEQKYDNIEITVVDNKPEFDVKCTLSNSLTADSDEITSEIDKSEHIDLKQTQIASDFEVQKINEGPIQTEPQKEILFTTVDTLTNNADSNAKSTVCESVVSECDELRNQREETSVSEDLICTDKDVNKDIGKNLDLACVLPIKENSFSIPESKKINRSVDHIPSLATGSKSYHVEDVTSTRSVAITTESMENDLSNNAEISVELLNLNKSEDNQLICDDISLKNEAKAILPNLSASNNEQIDPNKHSENDEEVIEQLPLFDKCDSSADNTLESCKHIGEKDGHKSEDTTPPFDNSDDKKNNESCKNTEENVYQNEETTVKYNDSTAKTVDIENILQNESEKSIEESNTEIIECKLQKHAATEKIGVECSADSLSTTKLEYNAPIESAANIAKVIEKVSIETEVNLLSDNKDSHKSLTLTRDIGISQKSEIANCLLVNGMDFNERSLKLQSKVSLTNDKAVSYLNSENAKADADILSCPERILVPIDKNDGVDKTINDNKKITSDVNIESQCDAKMVNILGIKNTSSKYPNTDKRQDSNKTDLAVDILEETKLCSATCLIEKSVENVVDDNGLNTTVISSEELKSDVPKTEEIGLQVTSGPINKEIVMENNSYLEENSSSNMKCSQDQKEKECSEIKSSQDIVQNMQLMKDSNKQLEIVKIKPETINLSHSPEQKGNQSSETKSLQDVDNTEMMDKNKKELTIDNVEPKIISEVCLKEPKEAISKTKALQATNLINEEMENIEKVMPPEMKMLKDLKQDDISNKKIKNTGIKDDINKTDKLKLEKESTIVDSDNKSAVNKKCKTAKIKKVAKLKKIQSKPQSETKLKTESTSIKSEVEMPEVNVNLKSNLNVQELPDNEKSTSSTKSSLIIEDLKNEDNSTIADSSKTVIHKEVNIVAGHDSEAEFPEGGVSDEDIPEDPLADPLATTANIPEDIPEEKDHKQINPGTIRVKNLSELKTAPASKPNTRKRRITDKVEESVESAENDSADEECGGKRIKMRTRRSNIVTRYSAEQIKRKQNKTSSSEEDEKPKNTKSRPTPKKAKNANKPCVKKVEDSSEEDKKPKNTRNQASKKANIDNKLNAKKMEEDKKAEPQKERKKTRRIMGLIIDENDIIPKAEVPNVRQSRRIAQLKIKEEAERRKVEEITLTQLKEESQKKRKSKNDDKEFKVEKRKRKQKEESSSESEQDSASCDVRQDKKKKKRGRKRKSGNKLTFDESKPWQSSCESSSDKDGEDDDIEFEQYHSEDEPIPVLKSDHEFSPESDLEEDAEPTRRARTAKKDSEEATICDDQRCQKCGKSDQPEWILLCDDCDNGYHCSCLKPVLFIIPEGDWYCPPCQQKRLIQNLEIQLVEFDKLLKKKEEDDLRRAEDTDVGNDIENEFGERLNDVEEDESDNSSGSSSSGSIESEEDESGYKLRERRAANVCYRFNDYDDLINKAIKDEMDVAKEYAGNMGRGKDISTIIEAANEEKLELEAKEDLSNHEEKQISDKTDKIEDFGSEDDEKDNNRKQSDDSSSSNSDSERLNRLQALSRRKKQRKLNALDVSSEEDHVSDEDFKGSSADSEDEDLESNSDFSDSEFDVPSKKGAARRSTRARTTRFDKAFINDNSDESSDAPKRKKKHRSILSDEEEESLTSSSEDSVTGWKSKKTRNKKSKASVRKMPKFPTINKSEITVAKKPKKKRISELSDLSFRSGLKKPDDLDASMEGRRTRGKKINYVDALASDSDGDKKKKKRSSLKRIVSEDEYVPLEEENIEPNSVVKEVKDHEIINPDLEEQSEEISRSDFQENSFENASLNILEAKKQKLLEAPVLGKNISEYVETVKPITIVDINSGKPSTLTLNKLQEKITGNNSFINATQTNKGSLQVVRKPDSIGDRISAPKVARVDSSFEGSEDYVDEEEEESFDEDEEEFDEDNIHEDEEHLELDKSKPDDAEDVIAQRMMEDPDFAAMRLQQVGVQIARDKRRKAAEEKRLLKEQRKIERLRKKDEKAKIKEEKAKEREEKKLAKQAALAALAATPVERKKPGRKPKALLAAMQNQQPPDSKVKPVASIAPPTGFNLGNISVTPIKTTQSGSSDSLKALSPMVSNPSSPCTNSSVSNASTSGIAIGTSPGSNPQNFSSNNIRSQIMNVSHAGMLNQNPAIRTSMSSQPNAGWGAGMSGLQNIATTPKRRGRGRGKKGLAAAESGIGRGNNKKEDERLTGACNLSVATPPQPFSASQPSPSVITRMLHNPNGNPPASINNPNSNTTATATCVSNMSSDAPRGLTTSPSSYPGKYYHHPENYLQRPRGPMGTTMGMYRPPGSLENYPPRGMYHSPHHPLDPSPSGGGPINVQPPNTLPTSGQIGAPPPLRPGTPPKIRPPYEYMHQAPGIRYHHNQPYGFQGQPQGYMQQPPYRYEAGSQPPPSVHQPPHAISQHVHSIPQSGSIIEEQQYNNPESENANQAFEQEGVQQDEESGEFGGLVSYFSSQHEDDLET